MRASIETLVNQTAYRLYRKYRKWVEANDIRQEMHTWIASKSKKYIDGLADNQLRWRLYDAGDIYCRKEKAAKTGYSPDDEVFYSMRLLREVLPNIVEGKDYLTKGVDDSSGTGARRSAAGSSMNYETTMADIRAAFEKLSEDHRLILEGEVEFGMSEPADVTRALRALQGKLGGRRPRKGV